MLAESINDPPALTYWSSSCMEVFSSWCVPKNIAPKHSALTCAPVLPKGTVCMVNTPFEGTVSEHPKAT
jgi:hypothetical protein